MYTKPIPIPEGNSVNSIWVPIALMQVRVFLLSRSMCTPFFSFAGKIQTNTFINRYRKKSREKVFLVDDRDFRPLQDRAVAPKRNILEDGAADESDWYQKIFSDDVKVALEEIPTDFRMVVLLADLYDFSYKETAEIVGCPIGTVMSRLYRGRRLLAAKLVDHALDAGYIKDDPRVEVEDENGDLQKVVEFKRRRRKRSG